MLSSTIEVVSKYLQAGEGVAAEVGSTQLAALRFIFGALFLLPLLFYPRQRKRCGRALRYDPLPMILLGVVGVFLTFYLFHLGVEHAAASTAAVVFSMNPVFTAVIAYFVLEEHLGLPGWTGVSLGMIGAFLAITGFQFSGIFGRDDFLGGVFMLLSALCWSAYTVYGKRYSERYGAMAVSLLSMAVGSVFFAVFLTMQGGWQEMASYNLTAWAWILYLGVVTVSLGYLLYFEGMRRMPASRGASLFYLKPVLALIFAYVALGESISYALLLASVLVAAGILLVTLTGGSEAVRAEEDGAET